MLRQQAQFSHPPRSQSASARLSEMLSAVLVVFVAAGSVIGPLAALGMLVCGIVVFALNPVASVSYVVRYWFILVVPFYFAITTLWSLHPAESLRGAVQLMATFIFAILVVRHLSIRDMRFAILCTFLSTILLSIVLGKPDPYTGAYKGLYGSKNALGVASAELIITALLTAFDRNEGRARRVLALSSVPVAAIALVLAKSTGTWILVPAILVIVWIGFVFSRFSPIARATHGLIYLLLLAVFFAVLIFYVEEVTRFTLATLGKDITLTGRTLLWNEAIKLIEERPILGHGYKSFWVQGYGPAEALWQEFGSERRGGFHFHNLYLSNAVEIGALGVAMQVFILYGAFITTFFLAVREKSGPYMLMSAFCAMSILQSVIEVPIMYQFSFRTMIMISALVFGLEGLKRWRARRWCAPVPVELQRSNFLGKHV